MNIWQLVKATREDYKISADEQYNRMFEYLIMNCNADEIRELSNQWNKKASLLVRLKDYEKLHIQNGGFVDGGDDAFYQDFADWIVAQGEELYNEILDRDCNVVKEYITKNDIGSNDYLYENIGYAFMNAEDYLSDRNSNDG